MYFSPRVPERAWTCEFYLECLNLAAKLDQDWLPSHNCTLRYDLLPWNMEVDIVSCYFLLAAVFRPAQYHRYLVSVKHCRI